MTFLAIYISTPDTNVLRRDIYYDSKVVPESIISSGLIEQTRQLIKQLNDNYEEIFLHTQLDNLYYSIMKFGDILVSAISDQSNSLRELVHSLGWRFLRRYGDFDFYNSAADEKFDDFTQDLEQEISDHLGTDLQSIDKPIKELTPADIFQLPVKLQEVAMAILTMERATVDQISTDINAESSEVEQGLQHLVEKGYLSISVIDDKTVYSL